MESKVLISTLEEVFNTITNSVKDEAIEKDQLTEERISYYKEEIEEEILCYDCVYLDNCSEEDAQTIINFIVKTILPLDGLCLYRSDYVHQVLDSINLLEVHKHLDSGILEVHNKHLSCAPPDTFICKDGYTIEFIPKFDYDISGFRTTIYKTNMKEEN